MRLHRFFINEEIGDKNEIVVHSDELIYQWRQVFRFQPGAEIILFDGRRFDYVSKICSFGGTGAVLEIIERRPNVIKPKTPLILCQSMIKKERFEWILEKGTEIGATEFSPVVSERSEKKNFNFERGRKIIKEAAEQSGRGQIPRLNEVVSLPKFLENLDGKAIVLDSSGTDFRLSAANFQSVAGLRVLIGPEGGWTPKEIKLFLAKSIPIVSIGRMTLRAETAAVAILALLLL
jgi:16S rRNA (uracil1498-N3)-methyltransferase